MLATIQSFQIKYILLVSIIILLGIATVIYFIFFRGQTPTDAHTTIEQPGSAIVTENDVLREDCQTDGEKSDRTIASAIFEKSGENSSSSCKTFIQNETTKHDAELTTNKGVVSFSSEIQSNKDGPLKHNKTAPQLNMLSQEPPRGDRRDCNLNEYMEEALKKPEPGYHSNDLDEADDIVEAWEKNLSEKGPRQSDEVEMFRLAKKLRENIQTWIKSHEKISNQLHCDLQTFLENDMKSLIQIFKKNQTDNNQNQHSDDSTGTSKYETLFENLKYKMNLI